MFSLQFWVVPRPFQELHAKKHHGGLVPGVPIVCLCGFRHALGGFLSHSSTGRTIVRTIQLPESRSDGEKFFIQCRLDLHESVAYLSGMDPTSRRGVKLRSSHAVLLQIGAARVNISFRRRYGSPDRGDQIPACRAQVGGRASPTNQPTNQST